MGPTVFGLNAYFKIGCEDLKVDFYEFPSDRDAWPLALLSQCLTFRLICLVPYPMRVMPPLFSSLPGDISLGSQV